MPAVSHTSHREALSADLAVTVTETLAAAAVNFPVVNAAPGRLGAIELHGDSLAGAATLSIRLFRDSACDQEIIPLTAISLSIGKTTVAKWSASLVLDMPWPGSATNLYLLAKTDAGSVTILAASSRLVWEE